MCDILKPESRDIFQKVWNMVKLNNWQEEYFFYQVVVWSEMLQMDHKNIQAIVAQQLVWLTYSCSNHTYTYGIHCLYV